MHRKKFFL